MIDTDILHDLRSEEINNNDNVDEHTGNDGVYSPMMMKHIKDQSDTEQKMKDDNFEVTNKQTDPDYETIHFNRQSSQWGMQKFWFEIIWKPW